jgi:hypothetical protein
MRDAIRDIWAELPKRAAVVCWTLTVVVAGIVVNAGIRRRPSLEIALIPLLEVGLVMIVVLTVNRLKRRDKLARAVLRTAATQVREASDMDDEIEEQVSDRHVRQALRRLYPADVRRWGAANVLLLLARRDGMDSHDRMTDFVGPRR